MAGDFPPPPLLPQLTLAAIRSLEQRLPLHAAAAVLGITPHELRAACRHLGISRWHHRAHAAAAAAVAAPERRTVAYAANLRRRYCGGKEAAEAAAGSANRSGGRGSESPPGPP